MIVIKCVPRPCACACVRERERRANRGQFKEADINYLIYVKAISQPPAPPQQEIMRFQRIKNLPADSFHRVFGDCFISGFLEGGEFTALVSISIAEEIKALEGEAGVKAQYATHPSTLFFFRL